MEEVLYECALNKSHPQVTQDPMESVPTCCGEPMIPAMYQPAAEAERPVRSKFAARPSRKSGKKKK